MSRKFTITVCPSDEGQEGAQTTILVDYSREFPRITEVHVTPVAGDSLRPADVPPINLGAFVQALSPSLPAQAGAIEPGEIPPAVFADGSSLVITGGPAAAASGIPGSPSPATSPPVSAAPVVVSPAGAVAVVERPVVVARRSGARAGEVNVAAEGSATTRPYRVMPDPKELYDTYVRGSKKARFVAESYNVPLYTARGWMRRLKTLGFAVS